MKSSLKTLNTARQNSSRAAVSVNTARPINTAYTRPTVNCARPASNVFNRAHSHVRRPFNKFTTNKNSNFNEKVNTVKGNVTTVGPKAVVSDNKGNEANVVKASACWVWRPKQKVLDHGNPQQDLKDKGVIDSGCSRHMTGNRSYLTDYEEIDGGFVAFGELKFNLFSVSQMCDKKNNVLFTDTECVVLSPDFKLLDESHVLLKVPRKDNMYSVDLKNVVPQGGLTCLFAKATLDESNLWHRRLGHINFKTMNTLVRGNLVRGLPSKIFENDHTCVACQKGKQHKASCKTKTVSSISQPLQMLHMDLFGQTFVKSIMKKMYCLVVTDDYSRISWVFFLATKDETSGILKAFITGIENLIDHKVKIIRCDNGTEFKNKEMNQFCEKQGIKREFSVARTPQQNRVAERKNRTLIEATRTMVLVIKPHNKTPYELFHGRTPSLSFMRPFGCPVIILNTLDHLGKFDRKADERFFIGYSMNSKVFIVFNSRTRIVEETLHITFLENKPNVAGSGPSWLFDIDTLTKSMNYKPVAAGNQSNGSAGTKACDNAGKARVETVLGKDYILLPLLTQVLPFSSSSKDSPNAGFKPSGEEEKKDAKVLEKESGVSKKDENVNSTNNINTVSSIVNTASINDNDVDENIVYGCEDDPNMPNLEEIVYSDDDEDVGAEADMTNLDTHIPVSPIPTTIIHKDHLVEQIIGDCSELTFFAGSELRTSELDTSELKTSEYSEIRIASYSELSTLFQRVTTSELQIGTFQETLAEGTEGALHLGPERPRVYSDLSPEDKERYNADIRATNILLQRLPKDIYSLINHYTDAKDIWDNVKMLLEGLELTKEYHKSQLYDDFEHFRQHKRETIHDYYVRFANLIDDMRNIKMTMSRMQLNSKFVNNMLP
ncbi:putative ribonuclease H-like domain-containing protein [Tanacetum coccineum]